MAHLVAFDFSVSCFCLIKLGRRRDGKEKEKENGKVEQSRSKVQHITGGRSLELGAFLMEFE